MGFNWAFKVLNASIGSLCLTLVSKNNAANTAESRKMYVVKHNLITEVYLMTVMETTTCFGLYWPSSGCLGNLRASYMHARARGVEISTYATPAENNPPPTTNRVIV